MQCCVHALFDGFTGYPAGTALIFLAYSYGRFRTPGVCESDLSFCCIDTSTGMQCNLSHTYLLDPRDEDLFSATWICTMPTEPRAAAAKDSHGRLEGRNVRVYRAQVKG